MSSIHSEVSLATLHNTTVGARQEAHYAEEVNKVGRLRAGNSGVLLPDGNTTGSCHRLTHLRSLGIEVESPSDDRLIMFSAGLFNEDYWYSILSSSWTRGRILREEEVPTSWKTPNGTPVTGRPDIVLCGEDGNPVLGLEMKMIASLWTAKSVAFGGQPKIKHMAQATHYMWQLGVPFKLVYTSYVDFAIPDWAAKKGMFSGMDELVDMGTNGVPKKVVPFFLVYDLRIDSRGVAQFCLEGTNNWTDSVVTVKGIQDYYDFVSRMPETKDLARKVTNLSTTGGAEGYSDCDYCVLKNVCKVSDRKGYDLWLAEVRKVASRGGPGHE